LVRKFQQANELLARPSDILESFQESAGRCGALEQLFSKSNLNLQQTTKTVLSAAVRLLAAVVTVHEAWDNKEEAE